MVVVHIPNIKAKLMENDLYILTRSTNRKVVGNASPSVDAIYEENISYTTQSDYIRKKIPSSGLILPKLKLGKRGKLTDLLSANTVMYPSQLLISRKLLEIFKKFSGSSYQTFPVDVLDKADQSHEYYIIHHYDTPDKFIDYEKTVYIRFFHNENKTEVIPVSSFEDYVNTSSPGGAKRAKALFLKEYDTLPNFFAVSGGPSLYFVKEEVANKILSSEVTGVCLIPFQQGDDCTESVFIKAMRVENPEWKGFKHTQPKG